MAINFTTGNPAASNQYVEPGDYDFRVVEASEETSKESGNPMVKLKARVIHEDGSEGPCFFDYLVIIPSALWKMDQFLASCGQHPGEGEPVSMEVRHLVGWEGRATLAVSEFKGSKNNKVANYIVPEF